MAEQKMYGKCPCCGEKARVRIIPAKWQGEKDKVVIEHVVWQEGWTKG